MRTTGHRSTTVSFVVVMFAMAVIWFFYKDAAKKRQETTPPHDGKAVEQATPKAPEGEREKPPTQTGDGATAPERDVRPPAQGRSALDVRVVEHDGTRPAALAVALIPLVGNGAVTYARLPVEDARTADVPPARYLVAVLTADDASQLARPSAAAVRCVHAMTLRPDHVETLSLRLGPPAVVSGTVRDFDDQPIAGAAVSAQPRVDQGVTQALPDWLIQTAQTNAAGEFRVAGVPAGEIDLVVERAAYATSLRHVSARFGDELIMHLVLADGVELTGRVTNNAAAPIAGALVGYLVRPDEIVAQTVTDARGRFTLGGLPHFGHALAACAEGYAYTEVACPDAGALVGQEVRIRLGLEQTISGHVLYADGRPARGTALRAVQLDDEHKELHAVPVEASADDQGAFTLHHLVEGTVRIDAADPLTGRSAGVEAAAGTQDVAITLPPAQRLTGVVLDEQSGRPVSGAAIEAAGSRATSGSEGEYELAFDATLAEADVTATADGYGPRTEEKVRLKDNETRLDLRLAPTPVARFWLIDEKNKEPVIGAPVRWRLADEPFARRSLRSSLEGEVAFTDARLEDDLHVEVLDTRFVPYIADVTLAELNEKEIVLRPGATIRGRVVSTADEPIAGAEVYVGEGYLSFADPFVKRVRSLDDGSYEMPGMPEGMFQLTAAHRDYMTTQSESVDTRGRGVIDGVDIVMDTGVTIAGRVIDEDGDPLAGAVVSGWGDFSYDRDNPGTKRSGTSDGHGRFRLGGLRRTVEGTIVISASARGCATQTASVQVAPTADAPGKEVVIALVREAVLHGRTVSANNAPVAGVRVTVQLNDLETRETRTDGDGRFVLDGLETGHHTLILTCPGFFYKKAEVIASPSAEPAETEIVLERGALVGGRIVNALTGEPVPLFSGEIATPDRMRSWRLHVLGEGRFTTDTVPDGDYVLIIDSKNMRPSTVEGVTVRNHAGPEDLEVRLEPSSN